MTGLIKHTIEPTNSTSIVISYTPQVNKEFASIEISRGMGQPIRAHLDTEDIDHIIKALRLAKKFSK